MKNTSDRYRRQTLLPEIGPEGARRLASASAVVIGCGALGTASAEILARAGVGQLRIVDRDFVERSNLQRQILFDETDADTRLPKAVAAMRKLGAVNRDIRIAGEVADVTPRNIERLIAGADVVLDGTDNAETRFLINDVCIKHAVPWVYGGAVGTEGLVTPIVKDGPCLRCFLPDPPPPGALPTCDTQGVLAAAPLTVAALQATEAIKILIGDESGAGRLTSLDVWRREQRTVTIKKSPVCPACARGELSFLNADSTASSTRLCGRNAVQITPPEGAPPLDLEQLRRRLEATVETHYNGLMLILISNPFEIVIFQDGRSMVKGTTDASVARTLLARYLA
jgi:molybdopterin-synthase adenylyltransferase